MKAELQTDAKDLSKRSLTPNNTGLLQRKCACGGSASVTGECEGCNRQRLSLQRSTRNPEPETGNSVGVPAIVPEVLRSPGQPLDAKTRAFMEPRFGHDFGHVRVHTDAPAAESATMVQARAYTVGPDIVFARGRYEPGQTTGQQLLAHELAHVRQNDQGRVGVGSGRGLAVSQPSDALEREADAVAQQVMTGDAGSQMVNSPRQGATHNQTALLQRDTDGEATPASPAPDPGGAGPGTEAVSGPETGGAEQMGVFADTRPVTYQFSIANDAASGMNSETSRFSVNDGRVGISSIGQWDPSHADEPHTYGISLLKWGLSDQLISPTAGMSVGRTTVFSWSGLEKGSYYLRVHAMLNVVQASAVFSGSVTVS